MTTFFYSDVIKYNYRNGRRKNIELLVDKNEIIYNYKKTYRSININEIVVLYYGPASSTYEYVKECKPHLCVSVMLSNRTYDFEFPRLALIYSFLSILRLKNSHMIYPTKKSIINNFKLLCISSKPKHVPYNKWYKDIKMENNVIQTQLLVPYNDECYICLDKIENNNIILDCRHSFHKECLKYVRKKECPVCRHGF